MKITYIAECVESVDNILKNKLKMSHRVIKENEKTVLVNGVHKVRRDLINAGDKLEITLSEIVQGEDKFVTKYKCEEKALDVIYEDEYILAVNKPNNMPVHPSCNNYENTLSNIVAPYLAKKEIYGVHIVTRLDKDTSGVCIFAKHPYVQELFNLKKEEMKLNKEYLAVVKGRIEEREIIEVPIARKADTIILREVREDGKYAKTEFERLEYNEKDNYSVVRIKLYTGRTHQIRVHMSYIGHTLLGDDLYARESDKEDILKLIKRQALHCDKISFVHPITNCYIELVAKVPEDMVGFLKEEDMRGSKIT